MKLSYYSLFVICLLSISQSFVFSQQIPTKQSSLGKYEGYQVKDYKGYSYQSQYLSMQDSVKLAVDVFLPKNKDKKETFPTIIYFVRYARSLEFKGLLKNRKKPLKGAHVTQKEIDFFTSNGYACVIVDLRGSGASFGFRKMEFSNKEVNDMNEVMDWIVKQPWSDRQLATTGISYTGTAAEFALTTQHPSLKACIARSSIFDLYGDVTCPGGIRQTPFIDAWKETTKGVDANDFAVFGTLAKWLVKGINPVQGDKKRILLDSAVKGHQQNYDIFSGILGVESRDDQESIHHTSTDSYSIHTRMQQIIDSKVPIYRISGWYDGANVRSAIKGFMSIPNTEKLLIGPWDHGPHEQISPFNKDHHVKFNVYAEMLRYFDYHMKGIQNGIDKEASVHYFELGAEQFKSVNQWPLLTTKTHRLFLSHQNSLSATIPQKDTGFTTYTCDYTVASTKSSRWNSLTPIYKNGHTHYKDRKDMNQKMVLFKGKPLQDQLSITGHTEVDLYISVDATDGQFFVYVEDVAPDGTVTYITEGHIRGVFRKVTNSNNAPFPVIGPYHSYLNKDKQAMIPHQVTRMQFTLLPIAYQVLKGHSLQISLANVDVNHFEIPKVKPSKMKVYYSAKYPSSVIFPFLH